jgi:hypothetical protein
MKKKPVSSHLLELFVSCECQRVETCRPNFHQNDRGGV